MAVDIRPQILDIGNRALYLRTVLWMTKIKETGEHESLQVIIQMNRSPPCSSVSLQMVICKEDGPPDDQHFFGRMGLKFAPDLPLV